MGKGIYPLASKNSYLNTDKADIKNVNTIAFTITEIDSVTKDADYAEVGLKIYIALTTNIPSGYSGYGTLATFVYMNGKLKMQFCTNYTSNKGMLWYRSFQANEWTQWIKITNTN